MATRTMIHETVFEERLVLVASDGWAYERPSRSGRVWRMPHDGGTRTLDTSAVRLEVTSLPAVIRDELRRAFC